MKTLQGNETGQSKRSTRIFVTILVMTAWVFFAGSFPAGLSCSEAWAAQGATSSGSAFCLHVSSFADEERAQHEVRRLNELGYPCLYREEEISGKTWFRVYLTGFDSMFQARRTGETLRSGGKITYYHAVKLSSPAALADKSVGTESQPEPAAFQVDRYGANVRFTPHAGPILVMPEQMDDTTVIERAADTHSSEYVLKKEIATEKTEPVVSRRNQYGVDTDSASYAKRVIEMPEQPKETPLFERAIDSPEAENILRIVKNEGTYKTRKIKTEKPTYPFSLSMRAGAYFFLDAGDFELEGIDDYDDIVWDISDDMLPMLAAVAEYHPTDYLSLEGSVEKLFSNELDIMFVSLDPKYFIRLSKGVSAYLSCGIVYGKLDWESAPGDFDCGLGMNAGAGLATSLFTPHLELGCDLRYRSIEFDYEMPHDDDIVDEPDDALNLTGFCVTGSISYHF